MVCSDWLPRLALSLFLYAWPSLAETPSLIRVRDAIGFETTLAKAPRRVLPLMPSLAELLDALSIPPEQIVGVTEYTDFPEALRGKPSVGSYTKPSLERIVSLKPDLVLASRDGTPKSTVDRLRKLGIPVVTVATETFAGLRESFPIVGRALDRKDAAEKALARLDGEISALKSRSKNRPSKRVMLQVGEDPTVVAAGGTYLNEGLEILGLKNVYSDSKRTYPRVSVEDVLERKPSQIVLVGMGNDRKKFERAAERWRAFPQLKAAGTRVGLLWSDALLRPGPRFPAGLVELETEIYGDGETGKTGAR